MQENPVGNDLCAQIDASGAVVGLVVKGQRPGFVRAQTDPVTGGISGLVGIELFPSGGDDTALIQAHIDKCAATGVPALFGAGDFIVSAEINIRSAKVVDKWGNQGIGFTLRGKGSGNTRFMCSQTSTDAAFLMDSPTAEGIGNRNYMYELSDFSMHRCTSGTTQIATGSTAGKAIEIAPSASGEVAQGGLLNKLHIDGFDYPVTLSDTTGVELSRCWFGEFLVGIRAGYNIDIVTVSHCLFGSEQFGSTYRNSAIAYQNNYLDGFHSAGAYENCITFDHCWFMKIGKAIDISNVGIHGLEVTKCYFEDCKQYLQVNATTGEFPQGSVVFRGNHFSNQTTNDVTQTDPTVAGYMAKIQFSGDAANTSGACPFISFEDNDASFISMANAWISFNNRIGRVFWKNNYCRASSAFGHVRCTRTGYASWRTFPNEGVGEWVLGDSDSGGLCVLMGEPIPVTATITSGSTYNISTLSGNHFLLTLPDGDCTIQMLAYSGTPPSHLVSSQTKVKLTLIVPASVTGTRTITWGATLKMSAATLTYAAAEQNKRTTIMLEGYTSSGGSMQQVSLAPVFV